MLRTARHEAVTLPVGLSCPVTVGKLVSTLKNRLFICIHPSGIIIVKINNNDDDDNLESCACRILSSSHQSH